MKTTDKEKWNFFFAINVIFLADIGYLLGQTTKQPSSNFELQKPWKYKQLSGLRPGSSYFYKRKSVLMNASCSQTQGQVDM